MTFIYDLLYITFGITTITTIRPQQSDTPLGYGPWNIGREWIIFLRKTAARMGAPHGTAPESDDSAAQPCWEFALESKFSPPFSGPLPVRNSCLPFRFSHTRIPPAHRPWATVRESPSVSHPPWAPSHNSPHLTPPQHYGNQQLSENNINFPRILAYYVAPRQKIDFKNVNPFSPLFPKILLFITSVQNLCSFYYYVNHINPHTFLWRMWITLRITLFLRGFVDFHMWITLRMECGKCWFFRQALCIFYN